MRAPLFIVLVGLLVGCDTGFKETLPDGDSSTASDGGPLPDGPGADAQELVCSKPGEVTSENVDSQHEPGPYSSIAVGPDGTIHISHYAAGPTPSITGAGDWHDARYTVRRGGKWTSEDIYTPGVVGGFTALGLDATGKLHVVFYDWGNRDLLYSWRDSQGWKSPEALQTSDNDGWGNDLAVDPSGTVHVITFKGANGTIDGEWRYLRRVGSTWDNPVVLEAPAGGQGPKAGIAVDDKGVVHVSYCNHLGQLKYRRGSGGSFDPALILDTGLGEHCASDIALDQQGQAQISYHDYTSHSLKFVGQTGGTFGNPVTLDSGGDVGSYNAIAAGANGIWIAYFDAANFDLKLIRRQDTSWGQPQTLDSAGKVGRWVSAALGPQGALHISHYNISEKALRYTRVCP